MGQPLCCISFFVNAVILFTHDAAGSLKASYVKVEDSSR